MLRPCSLWTAQVPQVLPRKSAGGRTDRSLTRNSPESRTTDWMSVVPQAAYDLSDPPLVLV